MDHWGDPWADANANDSPTKETVASPPPQRATFAPAPVLLNGFLDDAQWGSNEEDTLGGWGSPGEPERDNETRVNGLHVATRWEDAKRFEERSADAEGKGTDSKEDSAWGHDVGENGELHDVDNVVSEASDSATTIQPDDAHISPEKEHADLLPPDDDLSTRSSTSPSDISRNDVATESPRTSFEDERAVGKAPVAERSVAPDGLETEKEDTEVPASSILPYVEHVNDEFGDFEDNVAQDEAGDQFDTRDEETVTDEAPSPSAEPRKKSVNEVFIKQDASEHNPDHGLLSQLFPAAEPTTQLSEAPADPVHSTSTRKAWYRLARKQTMREYNNGAVDDNYIRVTWKTSHVRSEVLKTVSRWATEDRLAGRGPGARASFYWDTPAPENQTSSFHTRKRSSISASNPVKHDDRQSVPQLDTNAPAAFNWSSPSGAQDPWKDATNARAVSSPVAPPKHTTVAKLQRQEGQPSSVNLTHHRDLASHKQASTNVELFSTVPISPLAPPKRSPTTDIDPWASLGALDTNTPPKPAPAPAFSAPTETGDDDDEWGEMVESPAVSSAHTITEFAPPSRNNTLSTPATTPRSAKSSPLQPLPVPVGSKHASPIVRLKGTVSPTSALFRANAFVPASVEDGPIGPGLLKPRNRSAENTPENSRTPPLPVAQLDEVLHEAKAVQSPVSKPADEEFSAFETSLPSPTPKSATPPPITTTTTTDLPLRPPPTDQLPQTWPDADVDLSTFESSVPATSMPVRTQTPPPPDPTESDPWSFFDTPTPAAAAPLPFTRSPPRPVTPPPKQPLTNATSSAQKRKAEEDEAIRGIVMCLPDLGYMLRR